MNAPFESVGRNEARPAAQSLPFEPIPEQEPEQEPPQEVPQDDGPQIDLSSPDATISTFIKMFSASDAESVMACMAPDGAHYRDVQVILRVQPGQKGYDKKLCLQAFDPEAQMPIIEQNDTPDGIEAIWLVTFKTDFAMEGLLFNAGDPVRLDATMVPVDGKWLIDSIRPNLRPD